MSTPVRVAGFVAGLVAVFALALGTGAAFGPDEPVVGAEEVHRILKSWLPNGKASLPAAAP